MIKMPKMAKWSKWTNWQKQMGLIRDFFQDWTKRTKMIKMAKREKSDQKCPKQMGLIPGKLQKGPTDLGSQKPSNLTPFWAVLNKMTKTDGFNKGFFSRLNRTDQKASKRTKWAKKGSKMTKKTKSEKSALFRGLLTWAGSPKWPPFEQSWTKWQKQMGLIRDFFQDKKVQKSAKMIKTDKNDKPLSF